MFFRLLIFTIAGFVIYRTVKSWLNSLGQYNGQGTPTQPGRGVDDVMIKDPVCGTYFARRSGVALTTSHEVIYFCSNECRDSYRTRQSGA